MRRAERRVGARNSGVIPSFIAALYEDALDPRISYTRAGNKYYFNSSGNLDVAAANEWPAEYDPVTLAPLGRSVWEARTNSIRNNTMQGAVAGSPGTMPTNWIDGLSASLTRQVVGIGVQNGIEYIDIRYSGTTSNTSARLAFDANAAVAALPGQSWAISTYMALVSGSLNNVTSLYNSLYYYNADGTTTPENDAGANLTSSLNSSLTRYSDVGVATAGTIAYVRGGLEFTWASGVAVDFTLRIGLPQLELGSFVTPPIKTTGTAATRAADVATITGTNFSSWYNQSEGTFATECLVPSSVPTGLNASIFSVDDQDGSLSRFQLFISGTAQNHSAQNNLDGVNNVNINTGPTTINSVNKSAFSIKTNDFALCEDGGAVSTDTSGGLADDMTRMTIGARQDGAFALNGYIRNIRYYPNRLSNAQLQALTT
jgi:hypothetical protein